MTENPYIIAVCSQPEAAGYVNQDVKPIQGYQLVNFDLRLLDQLVSEKIRNSII